MDKQRIVTAAELDAMTPAERHEDFALGSVRPESLTPAERAWVLAEQERVIADLAKRERRQAS